MVVATFDPLGIRIANNRAARDKPERLQFIRKALQEEAQRDKVIDQSKTFTS